MYTIYSPKIRCSPEEFIRTNYNQYKYLGVNCVDNDIVVIGVDEEGNVRVFDMYKVSLLPENTSDNSSQNK